MINRYHAQPIAWIDFGRSLALHAGLLILLALLIIRAPEVGVEAANIAAEFQLFEARESPAMPAAEPEKVQSSTPESALATEVYPAAEPIPENPVPAEPLHVESHAIPVAEIPLKTRPAPSAVPKNTIVSRNAPSSRASSPLRGAKEALPDYLRNPPPAYPESSRLAREEGVVMLLVDVGVQGAPSDVRLQRSSGYSSLDQAAIRAVRGWRFRPGTLAGVAVASSVYVPVRFELH